MTAQREAADHAGRWPAYLVGGKRLETGSPEFAEAIAAAHAARQRPRCLCLVGGIEMYVARMAGTSESYIVKRMPDTGSHHAPDCPSYEPPPDASGLGQVLGSAITEDPATGETTLKLDFAMSKIAGRTTMPAAGGDSDSVASIGAKLSLRGLLHYLWDQAELTRWQPGFAGKRSWGTVRKHLLPRTRSRVGIRCARACTSPRCSRSSSVMRSMPGAGAVVTGRRGARQAAAPDAVDRRGEGDRARALRLQGGGQACSRPGLCAR